MHRLLKVFLGAFMFLCFCASAFAISATEDVGFWIAGSVVGPQGENEKGPVTHPQCPRRFYLGGKGESYASGIIRTASISRYIKGPLRLLKGTQKELVYEAPLQDNFKNCKGIAETNEKSLKQIFNGEKYRILLEGGVLRFEAFSGVSLVLSPVSLYRNQAIFRIAENL